MSLVNATTPQHNSTFIPRSFMNDPLRRFAIRWGLLALLVSVVAVLPVVAQDSAPRPVAKAERKPDASDDFFKRGEIPKLRIDVAAAELDKLRGDNRTYVKCRVTENGKTVYPDVGVKLKGAAGSFRELDDKPALTLNFGKFRPTQSFHALDKLHLNNSVQDETYLHELLCSELFLGAGVATPRVTHARVWLNDRDLGLFVLKEGFDSAFIKRHFENSKGNLYEGGFVQEIDGELKKDAGKGPDDRSDLQALVAACQAENLDERGSRIEELLDVENFITFMALELMTCHWDGYCLNRNNYRVYFDPTNNRAYFFPHGMDQMFGDPGASILDQPGALVASTVMQNSAWRARYRERIGELLPLFSPPNKLLKRVSEVQARLRPVLAAINPDAAREHTERVKEFKDHLIARAENLREQHTQPEPEPLAFEDDGRAPIPSWLARKENDDAELEETANPDEPRMYRIQCGGGEQTIASWRAAVLLAPGKYKLQGCVKTAAVKTFKDDKGIGAGLRISGSSRSNHKSGTGDWSKLEFEFEVDAQRRVELVAELRATKGQAWFDADSLRLVRVAADKP
jgi:hypothetical protein